MNDDGAGDFDFLIGRWQIRNERLKARFAGASEWDVFDATTICRKVLGGGGNIDEMDVPSRSFHGLTLRLYDPATRLWSLNWADASSRRMFPPIVGRFVDGRGVFRGDDSDGGRPVKVRFLWAPSPAAPVWEQAFSADGGETWETNWIMRFTPAG